MVFEDVTLKHGETLSQIASDYGYNSWDWKIIWDHHINSDLKNKRQKPENLLVGDKIIIPLPWKIISKNMSVYPNNSNRFGITVNRDGAKGNKLRWVQTVFQDNQPIGFTDSFCADACPGDDDDPFYYTTNEIKNNSNYRKSFYDAPWRGPHPLRTTAWRAVLSICSVSDLQVSVFESIVWGVDFGKNGINTKYPPRKATQQEISGHLRLLKIGKGKTKTFKDGGWTFREALIY
ncbi:LysM peptidoglycan-binding domain-containing protein [Flavobacterium branchiophilum]|uniref:Uncharacterized protein n=1 Tax=Flavobacterium branchiophilum (strain FL-15) TaxID=1034807 RepID=G2Z5M7_FLABF|nr:LysM peptidoglycan-binding domain-containing protein [Flavobacterium branchiophilum]CCB70825.1 Hypothetical protein FBFL15_2855 [Flavobacterium branchiophilum FL-15]